ncbi:ATP-binding cassette domain-containing protein [Paenalkalicoccus suaedae]|uniref:ATP-binding cassette domain-containing protein n=1 Tax=Paenalkalicoccus suaedae TaxID=2592382 RepID=A0A859FG15_9BACI|nr:ATP-binding cassette domain-containing protein [Paenalkalicoccus suaedae]QKS71176.1 ATP-binding cassette domain-containing protein [Paenalkalicoccus suaedae]
MDTGTIVVSNLVKTYKDSYKAVDGVSLEVQKGECFAFLGPNGAGKSTTVKILTTLMTPSSGEVFVSGFNAETEPDKVRLKIGVVLQDTGLDQDLSGRELLELQGRIFNMTKKEAKTRATELLAKVGLEDDADKPSKKYSGGMRRRLDLAMTLVHNPEILFLDEPTTGLDPLNRKAIWEEIRRLNKEEGTTVFLTTQYLEEADELADHIKIINKGKIVAEGTPSELKDSIGADVIVFEFAEEQEVARAKELLTDAEGVITQEKELRITTKEASKRLSSYLKILTDAGIEPESLSVSQPTLDDVFIQVTAAKREDDRG